MTQIKRASLLSLAVTATLMVPGTVRAGEAPAVPLRALSDCIALALKQNPDIISADQGIDISEAQAKQARGNFGPKLRFEAGFQYWNKPLDMSFMSGSGGTGICPASTPQHPLLPCIQSTDQNTQLMAGTLDAILGGFSTPTRVRDQLTWSAGLTLAQPLSALWTINEAYALRKLGIDVAKLQRERTRREVVYQVVEAYYRVIQLMQLEKVAVASIETITGQVQRAQAFFNNGMVGQNDLLRAQLGLANAQQRLIQIKGNIVLARGRLATLLGLGPDAPLEPSEVVTTPPPAPSFSAEQGQELALKDRVELREIDTNLEMARHGVKLNKSRMIPSLNAMANYTHAEGSKFQQKDAAFVGASLSWDVFEWGATYFGIEEAKARVKQVLTLRSKLDDMIRLDVNAAYVSVRTAGEALEVARKAVTQAEENYRIEQKRYEAANNTSFDVLDAESQLTNARAQMEAALYEYVIAESNLRRAIGRMPEQMKVKA